MVSVSLGKSFFSAFKGLEKAGNIVFHSKKAAEDSLHVVKGDFKSLAFNGHYGRITNKLVRTLLSRAVTRPVGNVKHGYRIVMDAGGNLTVALSTIVRNLRLGRVAKVLDKLKVPRASAFRRPDFLRHLSRTLRNMYPDAALESLTRRVRSVPEIPSDLFKKTDYNTADDLRALVVADKTAAMIVGAMEKSLKKGRPIVTKGLFFSVALTTASAAMIYDALAESAKRAAGCWRIYRDKDTNELLSCRVRYASCSILTDGDGGTSDYCERYPNVIKETSCIEEWSENTPCVHCDSMGSGTDRLEPDNYVDSSDVYVCRSKPSLGEMLGQVLLDAPHVLSEVAGDVVEGAEGIFGKIWNALKNVVVWITAGLCLIVLLVYFWNTHLSGYWRRSRNREVEDEAGFVGYNGSVNDLRDRRVLIQLEKA